MVLDRPDGAALPLVSEAMLHLFDRSMSMLPFATRTDMLDALKSKDVKIATVEEFLHSLQREHGLPNVRDQLRSLWPFGPILIVNCATRKKKQTVVRV